MLSCPDSTSELQIYSRGEQRTTGNSDKGLLRNQSAEGVSTASRWGKELEWNQSHPKEQGGPETWGSNAGLTEQTVKGTYYSESTELENYFKRKEKTHWPFASACCNEEVKTPSHPRTLAGAITLQEFCHTHSSHASSPYIKLKQRENMFWVSPNYNILIAVLNTTLFPDCF